MNLHSKLFIYPFLGVLSFSCSDDTNLENFTENFETEKSEIVENYANIVYANYSNAHADAISLQDAIATFTTTPNETNFNAAKEAWLQSRESYGTTEAFRFASGPIDDSDGPEGLLNAWPLDEQYIDYVSGDSNSGIINDTETYPTITKDLLESLNETGGEKNISIGYHAIEFLLWGQDLTAPSAKLAGQRTYTDFVITSQASKSSTAVTITNQDRRGQYLNICAELLTDHLQLLVDEWKIGGPYRTTFMALDKNTAIKNMMTGISVLGKSELAGERIYVAYANQDQEDEHSCFSDNTHRDVRLNYEGIKNVYLGSYGNVSGTSIDDLVSKIDSDLAATIRTAINNTTSDVESTGIPFDNAVTDATERPTVLASVSSLQSLGDNFVQAATALGLSVNAALPE